MKKALSVFLLLAIALSLYTAPVSAASASQPSGTVGYQGIDISMWNTVTSWTAIRAGQDFVMIRATHTTYVDPKLKEYATAAQENGIKKGFYIFFVPSAFDDTVKAEADVFWNSIKGYSQEIYPMLDIETVRLNEDPSMYATKPWMISCLKTFLAEFKKVSGKSPILYASPSFVNEYLDSGFSGYKFWIAHYTSAALPMGTNVWSRWDAWQYSSTGSVAGISGSVDLDRATANIFLPQTAVSYPVKTVQVNLNRLKIASLKVDGISGPRTKAAVREFERIENLTADAGIWGNQCNSAYAAIVRKPVLRQNADGQAVRYIQWRVGAYADGRFGPKTKASVGAWQKARGLAADGIVGPKTWAAMIGG